MNGQISVRHTAAAWTDSWSVRAGSVGGAAARTSVPVNAQAALTARVKGQGKHRASPARPNAVRRALTYATAALASYQPSVQPAVSSSGGSTAAIPQFSGRRQPQTIELRRSIVIQFTYPGAAPQFLAAMPQFTGRRQPPLLRVRRTSVQQFLFPGASPVVIPPLPITVSRRRAPLLRLRRSIISSRIAAPLNTGTGPLVPNMLRRHMWRTRMWRSSSSARILSGQRLRRLRRHSRFRPT